MHEHHHDAERAPGEDAGLGDLVMALSRRLRRARVEALEPYGLPPHQARAFMIVARHCTGGQCPHNEDELRLSALAQRLHIAPRSATEVVDALEKRDLVVRVPSATDRRATSLHITDAGRELFAELNRSQAEPSGVFATLSPAEQTQLTALLRKVLSEG